MTMRRPLIFRRDRQAPLQANPGIQVKLMNHATNRMRNALIAIALVIVIAPVTAAVAARVPSLNEVYSTARAGDLPRADAMMRQVLGAYPNSARAHYVDAQILAAENRMDAARAQLNEAERIAPGLPFVSPQALASLKRRLEGRSTAAAPRHSSGGGIPWYWLLAGGGVLLFLLARRRRTASQGSYQNAGYPNQNAPGYGSGAGPQSYGGRGGLWGSILSGLGFGAGAAAGEYALDRFLDRGGRQTQEVQPDETPVDQSGNGPDNLGGDDFGISGGNQDSGGWADTSGDQSASDGDQSSGNDDSGDFGQSDNGGDDGGWDDSSGGGGGTDV